MTIGIMKIRRQTDDRPPVAVRVVDPCVIDGHPRELGTVLKVPAAVAGELRHMGRVVLASTPISTDEQRRLDFKRQLPVRVVQAFVMGGEYRVRVPGEVLTIDQVCDQQLLAAGYVEPVSDPAPAAGKARRAS